MKLQIFFRNSSVQFKLLSAQSQFKQVCHLQQINANLVSFVDYVPTLYLWLCKMFLNQGTCVPYRDLCHMLGISDM